MRLLVVMPSGVARGGAEEALLHLAQARHAAGIELCVAFLEEGDFPARLAEEGIEVISIPAGRLRHLGHFVRVIARLRRLILDWQPEVVLSWMTKGHLYAGIAAKLAGVPTVYFQMGLPDGGIVDRLSRWIPAQGALACSGFAAEQQRAFVRHRVVAVPLAADHQKFDAARHIDSKAMKARLGFDPDRPLVGIVGRLQHWKGMHLFAGAMKRVLQEEPRCQAVIVGGPHELEPDYPAFLEQTIVGLGLSDSLRRVGTQKNVPEWMQAMDVIVHASEREPFGIVVVEAMSLGKPVVATRPGGPEEIVRDGFNGLLVPFDADADAMAEAILRFLCNPDFARDCGQQAQKRSLDFTREQFVQNLKKAVVSLLTS